MSKKNIIITGGTDGIGLALAKRLIEDEYKVFIIGKDATKGDNVLKDLNSNKIEFFQCDLSEKDEIINLSKKLVNLKKIDCLVNNAGAIFEKRVTNKLGIEKTFALNHLSYFHLSMLLIDKLEESYKPKIINVTSYAHNKYNLDLNDLENKSDYNSMRAYCQSKLLNIFFTYAFNLKIKSKITCNCLCPGLVNSNFGKNNSSLLRIGINMVKKLFAISSDEASKVPYYLVTSPEVENVSGKYFIKSQQIMSSDYSQSKLIASKVWDKSLSYIK